ncbi:MAG: ribose 5-phosphate isomerase B [Firmicutes bacterium]|nr:ribose 5-phosphate isomerase B [Bacillota bacterium]
MTVLLVCTGNTCRSPMAAALLRDAAARRGLDMAVSSAGISAQDGDPVSANAQKALKNRGLSLPNGPESRAKTVDKPLAERADLILTMTARHRCELAARFPEANDKIFTLGEYAGEPSDVPDPFGQDLEAYENCLADLERKIAGAVKKIETASKNPDEPVLAAPERRHTGIYEPRGNEDDSREVPITNIALGCDNAGFRLKSAVMEYLQNEKIAFADLGAFDDKPSDYPDFAKKVVEAVISGKCEKGILLCGTGIGVSIAANRHKGIRAALCHDVFSAKAARAHNDANVLTMGGRVIGEGPAAEIVKAFLETPFSGEERHKRRIGMIEGEP